MKILTLRLKNLNALQGEWKIDFTAAPFDRSRLSRWGNARMTSGNSWCRCNSAIGRKARLWQLSSRRFIRRGRRLAGPPCRLPSVGRAAPAVG
nr:hypothetical protein [Sodalis glossinidius]